MKTVRIISIWSKRHAGSTPFSYAIAVPNVPEKTLEEVLEWAFLCTIRDDRPHGHEVPSTSIGDIMVLDGESYMVVCTGFTRLTTQEADTLATRLTSRDAR